MRPYTTNLDPGDCIPDQLALDMPIQPKRCPRCNTTEPTLCDFDAQRADGGPLERRPRDCINQYDPASAVIPF